MNVLLSIIVPTYNAEMYLLKCLTSIQKQSFQNYECLIIDDGSTDSSRTIAEQFARIDNRFRVIEKSNGGVSSARNLGIREAKGEFLHFVDADDYLVPEAEQLLYERTQLVRSDVLFFQYMDYEKTIQKICDRELLSCVQNKDLFQSIPHLPYKDRCRKGVLYRLGGFFPSVWRIWVRRSIVSNNTIRFDERLRRGEDREFIKKLVSLDVALDYIEIYPYVYCHHKMSAMHTVREPDEPQEGNSVLNEWNRLQQAYESSRRRYQSLPRMMYMHACTAFRYNALHEIFGYIGSTNVISGLDQLFTQKSFRFWFSWKYILSQYSGHYRFIMILYKLKLYRLVEEYHNRRKCK